MIGWILTYFATNPIYLIAARLFHDFAGGGEKINFPPGISTGDS